MWQVKICRDPLTYAELDFSYVGHREGSHPMCEGDLNYTCEGYAQSFDLQPRFGHLFGELGV